MLGERDLRQLDELLARSPLALIAWDEGFHVSYWSSRARELFGYEAEDVLGKTVEEFGFVAPADLDIVRHTQEHIAESGVASVITVNQNIRADSALRTCRWTTFAVQKDSTYHVLSYAEDVTDAVV
ncbi:MAG TPA: PAS domain S-box protein, partial [Candidatus Baltobacteraceae bacterium]|nr:PAS domain S-box protein [Candidatus Baltobacteraceae bacterium]